MIARLTAPVLVAALAAVALGGCSAQAPATPETTAAVLPPPAESPAPPSAEPDEPDEPAEPSEPGESPGPTDAGVPLTADGVGPVAEGTLDPFDEIEELLGEAPDRVEASMADCGAPFLEFAWWGDLAVVTNDGVLDSWQVIGPDVPDAVDLPLEVRPGDDAGPVLEAAGAAGNPVGAEEMPGLGLWAYDVDGVSWFTDGTVRGSSVVAAGTPVRFCG